MYRIKLLKNSDHWSMQKRIVRWDKILSFITIIPFFRRHRLNSKVEIH